MNNFSKYNLQPSIQKALDHLQYNEATTVQQLCIPMLSQNKNIIAKSPTGSGKTAAYAIPILNNITWEENKPQALVIAPSRELAVQIAKDFNLIGRYKRTKAQPIFGKMPIKDQITILKQKNHIVVATPGRLMDLIKREAIDLTKLKYLIIDEADELLKHDFFSQMNYILEQIPKNITTGLFSATLDENTLELGKTISPNHEILDVAKEDSLKIQQHTLELKEEEKEKTLIKLLTSNESRALIFTMTKIRADKVNQLLNDNNINSTLIHSDLTQKERLKNLQNFRDNKYQTLVTTDLAARGLDIDQLPLVINYDLPNNPQNYTHRIGRTGRNQNSGLAINFVSPKQENYLRKIEEYLGLTLKLGELPTNEEIQITTNTQNKTLTKGSEVGTDIVKLYIQGGKKQKLRAFDIVGTLTSIENIDGNDIGIIEIKNNESYVEILNKKGDYALEELREKNIKGRKRKVHIAR